MTARHVPAYAVRLGRGPHDRAAAQRLRYEVFCAEMGADGPLVDHAARAEIDRFDDHAEHLLLEDRAAAAPDRLVGLYRVIEGQAASDFSSSDEFDLAPLIATRRPLLELSRSCLRADHRGGMAMFHLWRALADEIARRGTAILFGVASFRGTDAGAIALPLAHLHRHHRAPLGLRVTSRVPVQPAEPVSMDTAAAMRATPALIKAYLRMGGGIGQGAFVDHAFGTTDVCMVLDTASPNARRASIHGRSAMRAAR